MKLTYPAPCRGGLVQYECIKEKEHGIHFHSFQTSRKGCDPQARVGWSFPYLQAPVIMITTVVFLVLAILIFVLIGRVSNHPVRSFRIVGGIALVLSFLNPLLQLAGHWLPATGMNLPIFWTMIVMHCVSALITIGLLTTLAVEQ